MHDETTTDHMAALEALLDAERAALLAGDLERLTAMLEDKETLIGEMNATPQRDLEGLRRLDQKLRGNQLLLDGALEGIRTVAGRMAELRKIRTTLETYGADGRKRLVELGEDGAVERRA